MKSHSALSAGRFIHRTMSYGTTLVAAVALSALFTTQTLAQSQADPAQSASAPVAAQATPTVSVSAPLPSREEARLITPLPDNYFAYANTPADGMSSAAVSSTSPKPHHALAKAGIIGGLVLLGFGAGAYALAAGHCSNYNGAVCSAFHNGGIGAMAGGGALAATGFYFNFRK